MSAEAAALSRSWSVGRWTATMTIQRPKAGQVRSAVIAWSPDIPSKLTAAEIEEYRAGRNAALKALGLTALVLEL